MSSIWSYQATYHPTGPFTILEPLNPRIDKFYVIQKRRATDFKSSIFVKGLTGHTVMSSELSGFDSLYFSTFNWVQNLDEISQTFFYRSEM